MSYLVVVEKGETGYGAYVPDLPGRATAGVTRDEVLRLIQEAISLHVEGLKRQGLPVPEPRSRGELIPA